VVATTKEGYLIPTYGPTGISPSAGAEAGMAAGRAVQTQREQTLNSRQARNSVDQQMKIRTEEQRRIEEDRVIAAAKRARLEAERKKFAAKRAQLLRAMEAAAVLPDSGVVAVPGAPRAGLSFGPNTPTTGPVTMGVQPLSFGPPAPNSRRNVPLSPSAAMAAAGITFSSAPPAGLTESAAPSITEVDPEATAFQQDIQGLLRQGDIAGAINRIETGLAIGTYGPMGSPVGGMVGYFKDTPDEAARRTQVQQALQWFQDSKNASYMRDNPALIAQAAADPLAFVAAQPRGAPDAAAAETPTAPIQVRTPGGGTIAVSEPDAPAAGPTVPPAAAPDAAPDAAPAPAGVPTTRGTVAGEILGLPRGASASPINPKVIDAGPARMTQEMEMLAAQETQLALLQQYYVDMEAIPEAVNVQLQRLQLRSAYQALQGAQAVARMEMGDYSMAADALSTAMGTLVQIQPRVDGTFGLLVNGQVYADGLTAAELEDYVRSTTDSAYRQQQAELNKLVLEADIEREQASFKVQTLDSGKVLVYTEDGTEVYIIDPEAKISGPGVTEPLIGPNSTRMFLR